MHVVSINHRLPVKFPHRYDRMSVVCPYTRHMHCRPSPPPHNYVIHTSQDLKSCTSLKYQLCLAQAGSSKAVVTPQSMCLKPINNQVAPSLSARGDHGHRSKWSPLPPTLTVHHRCPSSVVLRWLCLGRGRLGRGDVLSAHTYPWLQAARRWGAAAHHRTPRSTAAACSSVERTETDTRPRGPRQRQRTTCERSEARRCSEAV